MENENSKFSRGSFLKKGLLAAGGLAFVGIATNKLKGDNPPAESGEKVKVLTADGKMVEVDSAHLNHPSLDPKLKESDFREGIEGKKFVKVIDLARCANARECIKGCQEGHNRKAPVEFMKVTRMQDSALSEPYWMPHSCNHCDNPPCTKVCPVDATFKRKDGIVMIDDDRCIGCRFCMAACPYNERTFMWGENWGMASNPDKAKCLPNDSAAMPKMGTVQKCDFCVEEAKEGKLPYCVNACPNGTIFYGDANEDTVTNGDETFRLSELLRKRSGYRLMEELGTEPRVYYLPPVNRSFPFEEDKVKHNTNENGDETENASADAKKS